MSFSLFYDTWAQRKEKKTVDPWGNNPFISMPGEWGLQVIVTKCVHACTTYIYMFTCMVPWGTKKQEDEKLYTVTLTYTSRFDSSI